MTPGTTSRTRPSAANTNTTPSTRARTPGTTRTRTVRRLNRSSSSSTTCGGSVTGSAGGAQRGSGSRSAAGGGSHLTPAERDVLAAAQPVQRVKHPWLLNGSQAVASSDDAPARSPPHIAASAARKQQRHDTDGTTSSLAEDYKLTERAGVTLQSAPSVTAANLTTPARNNSSCDDDPDTLNMEQLNIREKPSRSPDLPISRMPRSAGQSVAASPRRVAKSAFPVEPKVSPTTASAVTAAASPSRSNRGPPPSRTRVALRPRTTRSPQAGEATVRAYAAFVHCPWRE